MSGIAAILSTVSEALDLEDGATDIIEMAKDNSILKFHDILNNIHKLVDEIAQSRLRVYTDYLSKIDVLIDKITTLYSTGNYITYLAGESLKIQQVINVRKTSCLIKLNHIKQFIYSKKRMLGMMSNDIRIELIQAWASLNRHRYFTSLDKATELSTASTSKAPVTTENGSTATESTSTSSRSDSPYKLTNIKDSKVSSKATPEFFDNIATQLSIEVNTIKDFFVTLTYILESDNLGRFKAFLFEEHLNPKMDFFMNSKVCMKTANSVIGNVTLNNFVTQKYHASPNAYYIDSTTKKFVYCDIPISDKVFIKRIPTLIDPSTGVPTLNTEIGRKMTHQIPACLSFGKYNITHVMEALCLPSFLCRDYSNLFTSLYLVHVNNLHLIYVCENLFNDNPIIPRAIAESIAADVVTLDNVSNTVNLANPNAQIGIKDTRTVGEVINSIVDRITPPKNRSQQMFDLMSLIRKSRTEQNSTKTTFNEATSTELDQIYTNMIISNILNDAAGLEIVSPKMGRLIGCLGFMQLINNIRQILQSKGKNVRKLVAAFSTAGNFTSSK